MQINGSNIGRAISGYLLEVKICYSIITYLKINYFYSHYSTGIYLSLLFVLFKRGHKGINSFPVKRICGQFNVFTFLNDISSQAF